MLLNYAVCRLEQSTPQNYKLQTGLFYSISKTSVFQYIPQGLWENELYVLPYPIISCRSLISSIPLFLKNLK